MMWKFKLALRLTPQQSHLLWQLQVLTWTFDFAKRWNQIHVNMWEFQIVLWQKQRLIRGIKSVIVVFWMAQKRFWPEMGSALKPFPQSRRLKPKHALDFRVETAALWLSCVFVDHRPPPQNDVTQINKSNPRKSLQLGTYCSVKLVVHNFL